MQLYRLCLELYVIASLLVQPVVCVLTWVLLTKIRRKRLQAYTRWFTVVAIGSTMTTASVLALCFAFAYGRQDYMLASASYLIALAAIPVGIAAFVLLWKLVSALPINQDRQPPLIAHVAQEGVWPPPPQR